MDAVTLYSIGHSNRAFQELLEILRAAGITTLVDVRAYPRSRRHPQFDADALRARLSTAAIAYHWAGRQLGGRRRPRPRSPHRALRDEGLRAYADHMDTAAFRAGAARLVNLAAASSAAMLCAEREPAECHRSLLADYLTLQGVHVRHLVQFGETREHVLRPEARRESATLIYDRHASGALGLD
ncbi:MAG: DUF488 domain-containing protein [Gammaproteobacteria bacterium]|nr:DUF488 domain-containing protein [Gammaproteobacteria bacterium]